MSVQEFAFRVGRWVCPTKLITSFTLGPYHHISTADQGGFAPPYTRPPATMPVLLAFVPCLTHGCPLFTLGLDHHISRRPGRAHPPVSHGRPLPCQSCLLSCRVCPTAARYSRSGSTTTSPGDQGGFIPPSHTAARYHVSPACFRAVSAPRLPVIHARARPPHLRATRAGSSPRLTRPPATMSVLACFRAVSGTHGCPLFTLGHRPPHLPATRVGFIPPSHTAARYHVSPACFRAVSAPRHLPVIHARARAGPLHPPGAARVGVPSAPSRHGRFATDVSPACSSCRVCTHGCPSIHARGEGTFAHISNVFFFFRPGSRFISPSHTVQLGARWRKACQSCLLLGVTVSSPTAARYSRFQG